jgi:predicted nucleotidyltransferase
MVDGNQLRELLEKFAQEMKLVFQNQLVTIILYGSYAAGTQEDGSDIDLMILVETDKLEIRPYRSRLSEILCRLDFEYDVVLSPIIQNFN